MEVDLFKSLCARSKNPFILTSILASLGLAVCTVCTSASAQDVIEEFPSLKPHIYREPDSGFRFGFGVNPFVLVKDRMSFSFSLIQIHYQKSWLDWEILNTGFGLSISTRDEDRMQYFIFRTAPKVRLSSLISVGPLLGYEFVRFPEVKTRLQKGNFFTPIQEFSSDGLIFGGVLTQNFKFRSKYLIRLEQVFYKQNYSTGETQEGWEYIYLKDNIRQDKGSIKAGYVFGLGVSFIY